MAAGGGTKAVLAALFANAGIALAKFVAFVFTRSPSMLAESIHSVADSSNQGLLLLGGRRARREATPEHPFGYGRVRYFYAFVVSVVLFLLGGLFAMYEGIEKLRHPHELGGPWWSVGVLVVAIALETASFRTAIVESNRVRGRRGWWEFVRRAKTPELPVVLLEDLGALVGLVLALIGVGLAEFTHDARWDAMGSIAIGILLTLIAVVLAIEMKSLIVGESASGADLAAIRDAIEGGPEVRRLIHLRTQHLGPEELLVAGKVELEAQLSFAEVAEALNVTEGRIRQAVPTAEFVYLEPDRYDPRRSDRGP